MQHNFSTHFLSLAFVFLWATGFLGARYAMPNAEPFSFLSIRFAATLIILGLIALFMKVKWPIGSALYYSLLMGVFLHTLYLGAVFWAVKNGLPVGIVGILVGLQPILTAIFATQMLGDRISNIQIFGLIIGLIGVGLVLFPNISEAIGFEVFLNALIVIGGIIMFSLGTILQKKFGDNETLIGSVWVQYFGALLVSLPLALLFETFSFNWNGELIFALVWLTLVLSIGAMFLLMLMIKAGEATKVASYFYLVPSVTAITAYILFGETLNIIQIIGMFITSIGVALATIYANSKNKNI